MLAAYSRKCKMSLLADNPVSRPHQTCCAVTGNCADTLVAQLLKVVMIAAAAQASCVLMRSTAFGLTLSCIVQSLLSKTAAMLTLSLQVGLHGVVPVTRGCFEPLQENAIMWSNRLKQAFAVCNGLTMFNKNTVVGDDLGHCLFKLVEARFKASEPTLQSAACSVQSRCSLNKLYKEQ